jgi:Ca2+/Na+ antiporter
MSPDLERARQAMLAEYSSSKEPRSWVWDALGLTALNVGLCVGISAVVAWTQTQHSSEVLRELTAASLFLLIVLGGVFSVKPKGRFALQGIVGLSTLAVVSLLLAASGKSGGLAFFADADCALAELGIALLPTIATVFVLRKFAYQRLRTIVGAIAASATGVLVLHFSCQNGELRHLLSFHLAPGALITIVLVSIRSRMKSQSFVP